MASGLYWSLQGTRPRRPSLAAVAILADLVESNQVTATGDAWPADAYQATGVCKSAALKPSSPAESCMSELTSGNGLWVAKIVEAVIHRNFLDSGVRGYLPTREHVAVQRDEPMTCEIHVHM